MKDASVYLRSGRPVWYISYYCPKRLRRVHEATSFRVDNPQSHKRAIAAAAKHSAAAARAPRASRESWTKWVEPYLDDRFRNSKRTLERYKTAWAWILTYIEKHKLATPAAVSYEDLLGFLNWRTSGEDSRKVARNTALVETRVWGALLSEARRRGFIENNPADRLGLQRDPPKQKPEITDAELVRIRKGLEAWEGDLPLRDRWMSISFEIGIHQGCRLSETRVPLTKIDTAARTISFTAKGARGKKNEFTTALHPGLVPLIEELRSDGAEVTCDLPSGPSRQWFKFFKEHRLSHLCFHCTRVTVITRLARAGVPMAQAMRFVGHSSESVHRIYQKLRADDLDPCLAALADVSKPSTA